MGANDSDDLALGEHGGLIAPAAPQASWNPRWLISAVWLAVLAVLTVSLWWHWPFLVREHRRFEPWRIALIWFDDLVALFWFFWFGLSYCILARSLPPGRGRSRDLRWFLISVGIGIAGDTVTQASLIWQEHAGFANANRTMGEVVGTRTIASNGGWHVISCVFQDARRADHSVDFQIHLSELPVGLAQRLLAGQIPVPIQISYDPVWPDRNWLTEAGFDNENRLYYMVLSMLLFQALGLPLVIKGKFIWSRPDGSIPIYSVYPLLIDAFVLFISASAMMAAGDSW